MRGIKEIFVCCFLKLKTISQPLLYGSHLQSLFIHARILRRKNSHTNWYWCLQSFRSFFCLWRKSTFVIFIFFYFCCTFFSLPPQSTIFFKHHIVFTTSELYFLCYSSIFRFSFHTTHFHINSGRKSRVYVNGENCIKHFEEVNAWFWKNERKMLEWISRHDILCIPKFLEAWTLPEGKGYAIEMESVHGCSIQDMLEHAPEFNILRTLCLHALNAMTVVHNFGVFHGDLKPENFMVSEDLQVKVCVCLWNSFSYFSLPPPFSFNFSLFVYSLP